MLTWKLPWPAYACDMINDTIAVASFLPKKENDLACLKIQLGSVTQTASLKYKMAATKLAFNPRNNVLALSGQDVTLYRVDEDDQLNQEKTLASGNSLRKSSIASEGVVLPNSSNSSQEYCNGYPPVTSIAWSPVDHNLLLASSYDTTCTVWNADTGTIKTQLIAHDKEVFDVAFSPVKADIFTSVGAEGSLRMFDTRYLVLVCDCILILTNHK